MYREIDKQQYFASLKLTIQKDHCSIEDLQDVLNYEPTKNRAALDFRAHIANGWIDRSAAAEFVNSLEGVSRGE